jgi:site-specific DNA-methyltransferase (adenine-specific)
MKDLSDNSVDCFICDLPYGQLHGGGITNYTGEKLEKYGKHRGQTINGCAWDVKIDLAEFWKQVKRLARNDNVPVIHFCNTRFGIDLINSNPSWYRYDLVWDKGFGISFLLANKQPMKSHEMIYIFSKKGAYYKRIDVGQCPLSVINIRKTKPRGGHPTEKPMELYRWLLERYCPAGGTVLDPTAGSFNSIKVARELDLSGIGIEMDKTFYDRAVLSLRGE